MDTNHKFNPSKLNITLCAVCYRTEEFHGKLVTCESCSNVNELKLVNGIWMCPNCLSRELEVVSVSIPSQPQSDTVQSISSEVSNDHRPTERQNEAINSLGSQSIKTSEDYFNARTKAIHTRWIEILSDSSIETEQKHYTLAREVREHYLHMKSVLFSAMEIQLECASNQRSDQIYLNQLAGKLREEERIKLHLQNIDYVPPSIPKAGPKTPRISKDDKIAADYARIMNIPIETARRLISNKLKEVTGAECTCSSTPGICKIHK